MKKLFDQEAKKNHVYPLDDRGAAQGEGPSNQADFRDVRQPGHLREWLDRRDDAARLRLGT
jgi:hypothetical protein